MEEIDTNSESSSTLYMKQMDKLFATPGTTWEHRTLRTILINGPANGMILQKVRKWKF